MDKEVTPVPALALAPETEQIKPEIKAHTFMSADGSTYRWDEAEESAIPLTENEITELRDSILQLSDTSIQNETSGNGVPMGVKIPLSRERLDQFLEVILHIIKFKEKLAVKISTHAADRLEEDMLNGTGHPDFRGWLSEGDIHHCVCNINQIDGARLTINRSTIKESLIRFHSPIALEVVGQRPDGKQGTLAIAFIETHKIRIITIL
jgi:hypothetical protein